MADPSSVCVVAGQGGAPVSGSPREADSWDPVPKPLPVTAGQESPCSKVHLAPVLLPLLGCSVQVGEDLDGNFSSLSFASGSAPKGVSKGSQARCAGLWAGPSLLGGAVQAGYERTWTLDIQGQMGKKDGGIGEHYEQWSWVCVYGCASQPPTGGFGAGLPCQEVLFYQTSTFMVNSLCHHSSWESKNELTCAPQEQYLPSFQQRNQRQSLVRYN